MYNINIFVYTKVAVYFETESQPKTQSRTLVACGIFNLHVSGRLFKSYICLRQLKIKEDEHFAEMIKAKDEYREFYKDEMLEAKKEAKKWKYIVVIFLYVFHSWFVKGIC